MYWGLLLALLVAAFSPSASAQHTGRRTASTPYDPHLAPVRQTYSRLPGANPTIDEVRAELRTARRFRYYYDSAQPYVPQLPEVTEAKKQGDCKAKSLWLIKKMGDRSSRYVIGKATPSSRIWHAWLIWPKEGGWLVLDPTTQSDILNADKITGGKWDAKFSYNGSGSYAHGDSP